MKVDLFTSCLVDQFYPEVAEATLTILEKVGVDVAYELIPFDDSVSRQMQAGKALCVSRHPNRTVEFPIQPERTSKPPAEIDLSCSEAAFGIAETGTVVQVTGPGDPRWLAALPPAHLVLLRRDRLLNNAAGGEN